MDNITLAIPVYNTSSYFEQAVEYALSNNFVKEIVVSDDSSRDDEWEKLNKIVNRFCYQFRCRLFYILYYISIILCNKIVIVIIDL